MSGPDADALAALLLAGAVGFGGMLFMLRAPKLAIIGWIVLLAFVPIWWGVNIVGYWYPAALVGVGLLFVLFRDGKWGPVTAGDVGAATFFTAALAPVVVTNAWSLSAVFVVVTQWLLAFLIGRMAPSVLPLQSIYRVVTIVVAAVAAVALIEFAMNWNPFIALGGSGAEFSAWNQIYMRGGLPRVEGAWGHSIALGAALAMSIPLILASPLRTGRKLFVLVLVLAAVAVTFSRIGQITAVLAVVLSLYALAPVMRRSVRVGILVVLAIGAVIGINYLGGVYSQTGDEFAKSAAYRGELTQLLGQVAWFGESGAAGRTASGSLTFADFQSIDNALLLLGLKHGLLAVVVALILAGAALLLTLLRKAEPPTVALASQVPTLFAVALITQFGMFFWFVAGLAVAAQAQRAARQANELSPEQPSDSAVAQDERRALVGVRAV